MPMPRYITEFFPYLILQARHFAHSKNDDINLISATFHIATISFISMSMVNVSWFVISGPVCITDLSLGEFFTFGYINDDVDASVDVITFNCINKTIVSMMRIMILLCFMAIIFTLAGFFLDIIGPKYVLYKVIRRYAVPGTCTVLWIMATISVSYYVVVLLENMSENEKMSTTVTYGYGFYLLAIAGTISLAGIFYNLFMVHVSTGYSSRDDDRCLIENDDTLESFNSPTPPPPYNAPPPPYTP